MGLVPFAPPPFSLLVIYYCTIVLHVSISKYILFCFFYKTYEVVKSNQIKIFMWFPFRRLFGEFSEVVPENIYLF